MNKLMILFFLSFFFLSFLSVVEGLGVTPAKKTLDFVPGQEMSLSFSVLNTEQEDGDFLVYASGDLNESIILDQERFSMGAGESSKTINYKFKFPSSLEPGPHIGEIVVLQVPKQVGSGQEFVVAALGVSTQISVFIPYPGKYADAQFEVMNPAQGEEAVFIVSAVSRGEQDLARVKVNLDIYDTGNVSQKITSLQSEEIFIPSKEKRDIVIRWPAEVPIGEYRAVANLIYDEKAKQMEKKFYVGGSPLELQEVTVRDFRLGEIAKFEMLVENKGSSLVENAYAQTNVFNSEGGLIADFKSPTYNFPGNEKGVMVLYWDTAGIRKGNYDASIFLRYGTNSSSQKDVRFEIYDDKINVVGLGYVISERGSGGFDSLTILYIVIGVLVLVNILWFLVLRNKLFGKNVKSK